LTQADGENTLQCGTVQVLVMLVVVVMVMNV
jgi:hypothetical protein